MGDRGRTGAKDPPESSYPDATAARATEAFFLRYEVSLDIDSSQGRDMDTWIIADNDQLAARTRETLRHLAIECPGTHMLRAYDEFESLDFKAGITFTIIVG